MGTSLGCGGGARTDAGVAEESEAVRARSLFAVAGSAPRAELLGAADAVEARATLEGAGPRAAILHALAGALFERLYRADKRPDDAKRAIDALRLSARDPASPTACDASVRAAHLAGEPRPRPDGHLQGLYRLSRQGSASPRCLETLRSGLASLRSFRPPSSVLEAIDQGLLSEGALGAALSDAGAASAQAVQVAPRVTRIEQWAGEQGARVVVHLDRAARYRVGDDAIPGRAPRTFVELDGVELAGGAQEMKLGGIATGLRAEPTITGSRVLLDLAGPCYRKVFHLVEPYRVVIDIAKNAPGAGGRDTRKVARVVLDPGHGGHDPGAIGPTGLQEKDVTLAIAHKVAPVLAKQGLGVMLTRDDDRFVTLEERTARANAFGADLFVSVHCNAAEVRAKKGVETYVLDTAASEVANRIAARENATSRAATAELGAILQNMRLADQSTRSRRFANLLQRSAVASLSGKYDDIVDGGVHPAGFYVLVGARMPAALFEVSYVSNAVEERRLASDEYKGRLADAIANAIMAYREGR
ncbi:MAG: N-acetylmuramoyl-L-alanine amidase [Myxococcales bacterium]|nr:N-acetylmuramoyl-L-alanine amidase [Myxococcales bacterium]